MKILKNGEPTIVHDASFGSAFKWLLKNVRGLYNLEISHCCMTIWDDQNKWEIQPDNNEETWGKTCPLKEKANDVL